MFEPSWVRAITHIVEITLCVITIIFNLSLIALILTTKSKVLHGYKYLLLSFSLCELGFSITHMLMEPILLVIGNWVVFFGYGALGAHPAGPTLLFLWISFLSQIVLCLMLHFIYRYVMVVRTEWSFLFKSWHLILLLFLLYAGFATALFIVPVIYSKPSKDFNPQIVERFASMGLSPDDVAVLKAPISKELSDGTREYNTFFMAVVTAALGVNLAAIATILFCGRGIHHFLGKAAISERTRRQQHQLFHALIVQTAVPMICIFIPATVFALGTVFEIDVGVAYFPVFTLFVIFPVLDPLVIAYFIADYRRSLKAHLARATRIFEYEHSVTSLHEEPLTDPEKQSSPVAL
ncbi:unnamed protein product, partial [Mesorhabditis belari]|uniref:Uncharacterized protein n=1 Tax=Mesorhabditis belari TaxID=2138241 RepID=A0AAF3FIA3_9BILA